MSSPSHIIDSLLHCQTSSSRDLENTTLFLNTSQQSIEPLQTHRSIDSNTSNLLAPIKLVGAKWHSPGTSPSTQKFIITKSSTPHIKRTDAHLKNSTPLSVLPVVQNSTRHNNIFQCNKEINHLVNSLNTSLHSEDLNFSIGSISSETKTQHHTNNELSSKQQCSMIKIDNPNLANQHFNVKQILKNLELLNLEDDFKENELTTLSEIQFVSFNELPIGLKPQIIHMENWYTGLDNNGNFFLTFDHSNDKFDSQQQDLNQENNNGIAKPIKPFLSSEFIRHYTPPINQSFKNNEHIEMKDSTKIFIIEWKGLSIRICSHSSKNEGFDNLFECHVEKYYLSKSDLPTMFYPHYLRSRWILNLLSYKTTQIEFHWKNYIYRRFLPCDRLPLKFCVKENRDHVQPFRWTFSTSITINLWSQASRSCILFVRENGTATFGHLPTEQKPAEFNLTELVNSLHQKSENQPVQQYYSSLIHQWSLDSSKQSQWITVALELFIMSDAIMRAAETKLAQAISSTLSSSSFEITNHPSSRRSSLFSSQLRQLQWQEYDKIFPVIIKL